MRVERERMKGRLQRAMTAMALVLCMLINSVSVCAADVHAASETDEGLRVVRVGYYEDSAAFQSGSGDNERKSGYTYEYYQELAKYAGWTYEYEYGSWDEIYQKLLNGEVDIMAGISKVESRMSDMLFPDYAMGVQTYYIFVPQEDARRMTDDVTSLDGARLGMKTNSYMQELLRQFADANHIQCEAVDYTSLEERVEALAKGRLDGIVTVETDRMEGLEPIYNIGASEFYFAVSKDRPDLLEELNAAQKEILANSPYYVSRLQDKYFNKNESSFELTEKEKEWLKAHPALRVGYLTNYMPYCAKDEHSGEPVGMLTDVLEEFSDYMGVRFIAEGFENYNDMIQALESGEVDMIFPTTEDLWYSESQNYTQTVSVVRTKMCVVYKGKYQDGIYDRIALSEGSPLQEFYLMVNYPESERAFYPDWDGCMNGVQSGEVGCMLVNSLLFYLYMNQHDEFSNLNVAELDDMVDFCFAVQRGNSVLYSILNKSINNIDETTIKDSLIRNSYVEREYTFRDFVLTHLGLVFLLIAAFILLLIFFFLLYRNRIIRDQRILQEAYDREKEYIASKEEHFRIIGSLSRIYTSTYYINMVDRTYQEITDLDMIKDTPQFVTVGKEGLDGWVNSDVKEAYREDHAAFLELSTLAKRMQSMDSLSMEYETERLGWCRGSFISVARDEQGALKFVLYAIREINEEKRAQEQTREALQNAYDQANRANHAKSDFLARMSHDIRTPMNAIMGMTAIATEHIDEKERVSDCLKKITTSGRHLLTLINEVLDMSKIESGKFQLAEEEFNLKELIDNLLTMMQPQIDARQHELKVSIKDMEHVNVIGDSLRIQQVFVNILGNAIKYTPPGGVISLTFAEKLSDRQDMGFYEFVFGDSGIGMSPEYLEHIFEPFSRENETKDNHVQGSGLGLSIVYNIIRMMGGDIEVESERGKGSKFIVTLCLKLQENAESSDEAWVTTDSYNPMEQVETNAYEGKRVLLAEDNEINAEIAQEILGKAGLVVEHAWNGKEAVDMLVEAEAGHFDLVFMDVQMPIMDGYEATRAIRGTDREDLHKIPIIAMTANAFTEDVRAAIQAGMNQHIAKPIDIRQIVAILRKWLTVQP